MNITNKKYSIGQISLGKRSTSTKNHIASCKNLTLTNRRQFRDRVNSEIDRAMDSFERRGEATHSVAIFHTAASEAGEKIITDLSAGVQYIIFAMINYDDTTGSSSESEIKEQQGEIAAALNKLIEDIEPPIKLPVILLND